MDNSQNQKANMLRAVYLGLELGFMIAVPLVGCLVLGIFLDRRFGTFPLFLISSLLLSFIVAFVETRYLILPFLEKRSRKTNNH